MGVFLTGGFPKWMNSLPLLILLIVKFFSLGMLFFFLTFGSHEFLEVGYKPDQPIPFSHEVHVADAGMDCRYCHPGTRTEAQARIPETEVCAGCHIFVRPSSVKLAAFREAMSTGEPIVWNRVHLLPEYVSFHHGVHIQSGVPCQACHGSMNATDVAYQAKSLSMAFCLDCHRNAQERLVPLDRVTSFGYDASGYDPLLDPLRVRQPEARVECSVCHY